MNWEKFLESMTELEFQNLNNQVYYEAKRRRSLKIKDMAPMTAEEREVAKDNKINAIKMYRARTNCELVMAKEVVEYTMNL